MSRSHLRQSMLSGSLFIIQSNRCFRSIWEEIRRFSWVDAIATTAGNFFFFFFALTHSTRKHFHKASNNAIHVFLEHYLTNGLNFEDQEHEKTSTRIRVYSKIKFHCDSFLLERKNIRKTIRRKWQHIMRSDYRDILAKYATLFIKIFIQVVDTSFHDNTFEAINNTWCNGFYTVFNSINDAFYRDH